MKLIDYASLVVMVIIGLLVSYVGPRYFSQIGKSEIAANFLGYIMASASAGGLKQEQAEGMAAATV